MFKKIKSNTYLMILIMFYAMGSLLINLMAVKTMGWYEPIDMSNNLFGNPIIPVTTAGTCLSWLVFGAIDMITEIKGKQFAIKTFWIVGILNLIFTIITALICYIPGNPWTSDAYNGVFAGNWGIALSSILAFLIGNYTNTIIMAIMKTKSKNSSSSKGFTLRIIISTLVGQFLDNIIFYMLALAPGFGLGGIVNPAVRFSEWKYLFMVAGFTTLFELVIETAFSPLFHRFSQFIIRKQENENINI